MNVLRRKCCFCASLTSATLLIGSASGLAQESRALEPALDTVLLSNERPRTAPAAEEHLRPFAHLFDDTVADFRRVPSRDTLKWLSIGVAAAALTHVSDRQVTNRLSSSAVFGETLKAGELLGGASVQHASALATYLIGRVAKKPRVASIGSDLLQAQLVAQALTSAIKVGVGRTRPDGTDFSFPSGHAAVTFATATVLQRDLGWKVGIPAYGLATYVAASRIQVKRHFLSDVAFGAVLGIVAGRVVTVGRGEARFAVSPMPLPGGGGVSFAWVGSR